MSNYEEIEKAKAVLKANGYQVDNLWHIDDVKSKFTCDDDDAYEILVQALMNEATMEQIRYAIRYHAEEEGLEDIEDIE